MKKIIMLLLICIILCGCNVRYELTISKDNIQENINLETENYEESRIVEISQKPLETFINSPMYSESNEKIEGVEYYNISKNINNSLYNMNINYDFNFENFEKSNILNLSVSKFHFDKKGKTYRLTTGANIKAYDSYKGINNLNVVVNLSNDYEIIANNAHNVVGNKLEWNITSRYTALSLTFREKKNNVNNNENNVVNTPNNDINNSEPINNTADYILIGCLLTVFVCVIIIILVFSKKVRK